MSTPKKYIDSHWLIFLIQGVTALLFGWFVAFTGITSVSTLVVTVAIVMLLFGIIELGNLLHRTHLSNTWGLSLAIAVVEIGIAMLLLFTQDQNVALHMTIIGGYTLLRGILEIIIGLRSLDDQTDKAIWVVCGICGAILGFVVINSGHISAAEFLRAFGIYMIIYGICSMIYGIHNRDQKYEYIAEHTKKPKRTTKSKKTAKSKK